MYIDDIKLFGKNEKEVETLNQTIRMYNQYIRMEFFLEKSVMLIMKKWKKQTGGTEL